MSTTHVTWFQMNFKKRQEENRNPIKEDNTQMISVLRSKQKFLDCHLSELRIRHFTRRRKPLASEVLTSYLLQMKEPPWTSYFVKYADVRNDQRGMSHFNWSVGKSNYHVLRTGCFPYIKYHCTKRAVQDLSTEDKFFKAIKILNLGIPTLLYGLAATQLIRHEEVVTTKSGKVTIYFLLPEDKGSLY